MRTIHGGIAVGGVMSFTPLTRTVGGFRGSGLTMESRHIWNSRNVLEHSERSSQLEIFFLFFKKRALLVSGMIYEFCY